MNQTTRRTIITAAGAVGIASALPRFAIGQPAWPSKPIRIVVTNPAGGLTDPTSSSPTQQPRDKQQRGSEAHHREKKKNL